MLRRRPCALLLGVWLWNNSAVAQRREATVLEITYIQAITLAKERAPEVLIAKARVHEAQSELDAAGVWQLNPQLKAAVGPRMRSGATLVDWNVAAQQWIELGGQRGRRIELAEADHRVSTFQYDDTQRRQVGAVALAFVLSLYWNRRIQIADENLLISERIQQATSERYALGDVGGLEKSVASLSMIQARAELAQARVSQVKSVGRLKSLLGIPPTTALSLKGSLREQIFVGVRKEGVVQRPDLLALRARAEAAKSDAALGKAHKVPNLAVGLRYANEEVDDIVQGTLSLSLPVFDHGQGAMMRADARRERLLVEASALSSVVSNEVHVQRQNSAKLDQAVRQFEEDGLEVLKRAEQLATESYRSGAIPLGELLLLRRELINAHLVYADLLLAAASARTELATSTGAF